MLTLGQCEEAVDTLSTGHRDQSRQRHGTQQSWQGTAGSGAHRRGNRGISHRYRTQTGRCHLNLVNFGAALLEQRAWDDASAVTRRAISLQPDNAMAHANLGTALMNLGRHEEALAACHQAMALGRKAWRSTPAWAARCLSWGHFRKR